MFSENIVYSLETLSVQIALHMLRDMFVFWKTQLALGNFFGLQMKELKTFANSDSCTECTPDVTVQHKTSPYVYITVSTEFCFSTMTCCPHKVRSSSSSWLRQKLLEVKATEQNRVNPSGAVFTAWSLHWGRVLPARPHQNTIQFAGN